MDEAGQQSQAVLLAELGADVDGAFPQLVFAYQDRLYSFALRLAGNGQDAEEVVQDALWRAYRALRAYPAERIASLALRPWLYRIMLNAWRNRVRRKRLPTLSLRTPAEEEVSILDPAGPEDVQPEAAAQAGELRATLAAGLARLPDRYRAAVALRYVEELGYAEVAQVLGMPIGTVKSDVHRGLKRLRCILASESPHQEEE